MKFILDGKKIREYLCEDQTSITQFAKKNGLTIPTLTRAIDGEEVYFATVSKIAGGLKVSPHALILAEIKAKKTPDAGD